MGQITIAEWQQWKQDIKDRLNQTVENFIVIGYRLRQIRDTEAYSNDGYTSLSEFARKEFNLSDSTVNRFMAINAKFTVEGNGTEILPEFKGISYSKLQEMLTLSDEDCKLITVNTTVKEIRELKDFNHDDEAKYMPQAGQQPSRTPLQECIWDFFGIPGNRELLEDVIETTGGPFGSADVANIADTISPSGNRTHRKGIVFLFMYDYDRGVAYKLMTSPVPVKIKWEEFLEEIRKTYADYMTSEGSIWEAAYGSLPEAETQIPGQMDITQIGNNKKAEPEEPQKIENITDRAEIVEKTPEKPESVPKEPESVPEKPENVINTKYAEHSRLIEEIWTEILNNACEISGFISRHSDVSGSVPGSMPRKEIEEAYGYAVSLAAGLEKMLINTKCGEASADAATEE